MALLLCPQPLGEVRLLFCAPAFIPAAHSCPPRDASDGPVGRHSSLCGWGEAWLRFHLMAAAVFLRLSPSLVLLVFLNMMLFYKLWMLEYTTQTLTAWQGLRLQER